jgi:hypothetical protein
MKCWRTPLVLCLLWMLHTGSKAEEPASEEVTPVAKSGDLMVIVPPKNQGIGSSVIRSEEELVAARGIPENKRDEATLKRVAAEAAKSFQVSTIDFQKTMIVSVAFPYTPSPKSSVELYRVERSADGKQLIIFWRWISPAGGDDDMIGHGRILSLLLPKSDAAVVLRRSPARQAPAAKR